MAGYASTPLGKKLSLKPGMRVVFEGMPAAVEAQILSDVGPLSRLARPARPVDAIHLFTAEAAHLRRRLPRARAQIVADGLIWVSWPKRASKQPTDITEDTVRAVALPLGLVDVKVCAVDAVWSGLKLVIRKELRGKV